MIAANGDMEIPKEYSYQKPEQALTVPHEYVKQVLMRGGVFSGSKKRIYAMFQDISDPGERVKAIRWEYGEQREGFFMSGYTDNSYGKCKISRDKDGIEISYPRADGTKGEKRVDYRYCADLILHMIEENDYLTEGIFERFREAPGAFAAMPWFMEIYHEYKERMLQEPDFAAVSIDGQEEERQEGQEPEAAAEEIQETRQTAENGQDEIPETWLLDGELRETQTADYFSGLCPIDCAVLSVNA